MTDLALESSVRDLVARYCDAVAFADAPEFASCWATGAEWLVEDVDGTVSAKCVEGFPARRARLDYCVQQVLSGRITSSLPSGGAVVAEASWLIQETLREPGGVPRTVVGRYADRITVEGGVHRFASRRLTRIYSGPLDFTGAVRTTGTTRG